MSEADAVLALSRFGYGARPGDLALIADDPRGALIAETRRRDAADLADTDLPTAPEAFRMVRDDQLARKAGMVDEDAPRPALTILRAEMAARMDRLASAQTGFVERLVAFWMNHFAIEADQSAPVKAMAGAFEREAIRPHVLGRFEDMLVAATSHPAMLLYLDNASSVGPNSPIGKRRGRGINENHARELMELHTVGVDGGYSQADVIAFAKVLTGWMVARNDKNPESFGSFVFNGRAHEPGSERVMDVSYPEAGHDQGIAVLHDLARRPATARHLAGKFAEHFVADLPPGALVDRLAATFLDTDGDLAALARALLRDDAAWEAPREKLRTPQEFVFSALRATSPDLAAPFALNALSALGQPLWDPPSPAGFKDDVATWLAPAALTVRLELADRFAARSGSGDPRRLAEALFGPVLSAATRETVARAESPRQGLTLLLMSPEFQRR